MSRRRPPAWLFDESLAPPPLVGPMLAALTLVQSAGMWMRAKKTKTCVDARVISFGNITAGGTGKTPAVIERAQQEVAAGNRVAVITRGYGSAPSKEPLVVAPMQTVDTEQLGDEASLIRLRVPGVWVVKSADRVAGAQVAIAEGCTCLILDDGFQSLSLERDEDIVLLDAMHPFGNGHLIPRGILRESPSALARATEVWLTRCDLAPNLDASLAAVTRYHGKPPARLTRHAPVGLWRVCDGATFGADIVRGNKVFLACGIARPEALERTVTGLGATVSGRLYQRDHEAFRADALPKEGLVLVTEKDAVRLPGARDNVYALAVCLEDWT
jgi:tetraacyldisaccharide 4'-kinase